MTTLTAVFRAQDKLSGTLSNVGTQGDKVKSKLEKLGKIGKTAIKGIITAAGAAGTALVALGKRVLDVGMTFESSMAQVAATMGETVGSEAYTKLAAAAKEWGSKTAFTSSEAADALNYLALAGYDADQSIAALPTVLQLAGAGGMQLAQASDLITDSMAALGLEASQENLSRFADQMAKTASTTNTSVSQLGEATLTVGATAANLKNGTTELNTQLGILANVGIKGAEGGTHLRNILLRLQSPTKKAAEQMSALGISVYDSEGNMRDTGEIFLDLKKSMDGMSQSEIDAVMAKLFNKTDIAAANALLNASGDEYQRIFEIIAGSEGAAGQMYDTMLDNLSGDKAKFQSALEAIYLEIFDDSNQQLRGIVQLGNKYLDRLLQSYKKNGFAGLASELGSVLGDALTRLIDSLPAVLDMGGKVINALLDSLSKNARKIGKSAVDLALKAVNVVYKAMPKLLKLALKLVQGLIQGIFRALPNLLGSFSSWIGKVFNGQSISSALGKGSATISSFLDSFRSGKGIIQSLSDALFKNFGAKVSTNFAKMVGNVRRAFANIGEALKNVWTTLKNIDWAGIWDAVKKTAGELWEALKTVASTAFASLKIWFLSIDWAGIWARVSTTVFTLLDKLKTAATSAFTLVKAWFLSVDWSGIWSSVTTTAVALWEKLKAAAVLAFALAKLWFSTIDWAAIWATVSSTASALWEKIKTVALVAFATAKFWFLSVDWSGIWATVSSTASALWEKLKAVALVAFTTAKVWFLTIDWSGIWTTVSSTASALWEKLKAVALVAFTTAKVWFLTIDWSGIWATVASTASALWEKLKAVALVAFTTAKVWFLTIDWSGIWATVTATASALWDKLKTAAQAAFAVVKVWFLSIDWSGIWATVTATASSLWEKLKSVAGVAVALVKAWFLSIDWAGIWATITGTASALLDKLKAAASFAFALIKVWFASIDWSAVWSTITSTASTLLDKLKAVATSAFALLKIWFLSIDWSAVWNTVSTTASALWEKLKGAAASAFALVKIWFATIDWSAVWATVTSTASALYEKLKSAASAAFALIKVWFLTIDWSGLWANITSTAATLWDKLKSGISATGDRLKALILGEDYEPGIQWTFVGKMLLAKIKSGITFTGDKLKELLLGEDYTPDATWGAVMGKVWTQLKTGITAKGDRLKELILGSDYEPGASWWAVGALLWSKLKSGITATGDKLKALVLGEDYTPDATWGTVMSTVWTKLKSGITVKGDKLKALVLGDDYSPDATWVDVGKKLFEKIKEGVQSAGNWLSGALFGSVDEDTGEKTGGIDFSGIWDGISSTGAALKAKISEMLQNIPTYISELAKNAKNFLTGGTFASLGSAIAEFISSAITSKTGGLAATIINAITGLFSDDTLWDSITVSVTAISAFLKNLLVKAIEGIGTGVTALVTALSNLLTSAFNSFNSGDGTTGFSGTVTTLGSGIVDTIASAIKSAVTNVTAIVTAVGDLLKNVFTYENMQKVAGLLVGIRETIYQMIIDSFSGGEDGEGIDITGLASSLGSLLGRAVAGIANLGAAIAQKLVEWFSSGQVFVALWAIAQGLAKALWSFVQSFFSELMPGLFELVTGGGTKYVQGENGMLFEIDESVQPGVAQPLEVPVEPQFVLEDGTPDYSALLNSLNGGTGTGTEGDPFGGASITIPAAIEPQMPTAEEFAQQMQDMFNTNLGGTGEGVEGGPDVSGVGVQVAVSIGTGVSASQPTLQTTIQTTVTNAVNACTWSTLSTAGTSIVSSISTGISSAVYLVNFAMNSVKTAIETKANVSLFTTGQDIVSGLIRGLNSMKVSLQTTATEIGDIVKEAIQTTTEVSSPSRFTTWIGEMVGAGLERGLTAATGDVAYAAAGMAESVNGAFGNVHSPSITTSPYGTGAVTDGISAERHLTIDVRGGGRIEVGGMTREAAVELITESLLPQLKQALADEIYEGGDDVYDY